MQECLCMRGFREWMIFTQSSSPSHQTKHINPLKKLSRIGQTKGTPCKRNVRRSITATATIII